MTDELDALKAALKGAPAPDAQARAEAIALAMKNYDGLQGSADPLRPIPDRQIEAGIWNRTMIMLKGLSRKQALAGTASVAAICVAVVLVGQMPAFQRAVDKDTGEVLNAIPGGDAEVVAKPEGTVVSEADEGRVDTTAAPEAVVEAEPKPAAKLDAVDAPASPVTEQSLAEPTGQVAESLATIEAEPAPEFVAETEAPKAEPQPEAMVTDDLRPREKAEAEMDGTVQRQAAPSGSVAGLMGGSTNFAADSAIAGGEIAFLPAPDSLAQPVEPNTEAFSNEAPNPVKVVSEEPVSTFSIDVDTASYSVVRNSLNMGMLPPPEAVRIEEMVNYFPYDYPAPKAGEGPFQPSVTVMQTPWNPGTRLVHIGIQGEMPATDERPPLNLVFLIDTSGSMDEPNKLPLLVNSFQLMLGQLRPQDQVAIVAYAGSAGVVLEPTQASDVAKISAALNNLAAGGSTAGAEGLELAYQVAAGMGAEGEVSRVLLATDGDFNVGVSDPEGLEAYVAKKRETGIYLSVLGFGRGNLDDAIMQSLAQNGNGTAAYIDTLNEARKVLVDQLTGALFPIADDVKIQVEWNPAAVTEYRLIGYETRALKREDFNNDHVDAGEIGAGVTVTAIYEVVPFGSDARLNDPLRYGSEPAVDVTVPAEEMGFLRLRSKAPGASASVLLETPIANRVSETVSDDARFATAIAGFGQLLTGATYLGDWGWDEAIALGLGARGEDPFGYRIEAVNLMRMAQGLSQ